MDSDKRKGVALTIVGLAMGICYSSYMLNQIRSRVEGITVSRGLLYLSILLVVVGAMHIALGARRTTELLSFNTSNLSKRDILVGGFIGLSAIALAAAVTLYLNSQGYV